MSVESTCPPMPIHAAENESTAEVWIFGTVQEPLTWATVGKGKRLLEATA